MTIHDKQMMRLTGAALLFCAFLSSCSKNNPNHLPAVSPADFQGKVEGFDSSGEVASENLVAYWSFDGTEQESFSRRYARLHLKRFVYRQRCSRQGTETRQWLLVLRATNAAV